MQEAKPRAGDKGKEELHELVAEGRHPLFTNIVKKDASDATVLAAARNLVRLGDEESVG